MLAVIEEENHGKQRRKEIVAYNVNEVSPCIADPDTRL